MTSSLIELKLLSFNLSKRNSLLRILMQSFTSLNSATTQVISAERPRPILKLAASKMHLVNNEVAVGWLLFIYFISIIEFRFQKQLPIDIPISSAPPVLPLFFLQWAKFALLSLQLRCITNSLFPLVRHQCSCHKKQFWRLAVPPSGSLHWFRCCIQYCIIVFRKVCLESCIICIVVWCHLGKQLPPSLNQKSPQLSIRVPHWTESCDK